MTDDESATGSTTVTVTVVVAGSPIAIISPSTATTIATGQTFNALDGGSNDPDGTDIITQWDWDWGDASPVTTVGSAPGDATHIFSTPGIYRLVLTVTDNESLTATDSLVVTVTAATGGPVLAATDVTVMGTVDE